MYFIYGGIQYSDVQIKNNDEETDTFHAVVEQNEKDLVHYNEIVGLGVTYFILLKVIPLILIAIINHQYHSKININIELNRELAPCQSTHRSFTAYIILYLIRLLVSFGFTVAYFSGAASFCDIVMANWYHDESIFDQNPEDNIEIKDVDRFSIVLAAIFYTCFTLTQIYIIIQFFNIRMFLSDIVSTLSQGESIDSREATLL